MCDSVKNLFVINAVRAEVAENIFFTCWDVEIKDNRQ